ncbi:MAG: TrmH family RNA methyltransferase [Candidatus Buchananbacteria bacterium]|nr:TrmH family RNA methyltransferase [Candidatus Buchananbacteria bacterium]
MLMKKTASQLRHEPLSELDRAKLQRREVYVILDDIIDTYNVGAMFRLADATGIKKMYLCGQTLTPPNPRITKSSVNTWQWVDWEYASTAVSAITYLRRVMPNIRIIAIEQTPTSIPYTEFQYDEPIALIVGNETFGMSQATLDLVDASIELPLIGINTSLNVMVTLGIVLYKTLETHS